MFFGGFPGFSGANFDQSPGADSEVDNKEFYEILGVEQAATADDIRKAYRKKVVKAHPDKGGDVEEFKKLQAAYEVLSNPEKRELYDQYGIDGIQDGGSGEDPFDALFGGLFGRGRRGGGGGKPQAKKMKPIVKEISVTLEDLCNGGMKHVNVKRHRVCESCEGKGGKDAKKCGKCKGNGMVEKFIQLGPGFMTSTRSVCPDCRGEGMIFDEKKRCRVCKGEKIKQEDKKLEVPIEVGAPNEHHVVFSGEGDEIPGALGGDVIVQFNVMPHERFERKGADIYYKKHISLYEALTGTAFYVQHLDGKKILVATSPNEVITPNVKKQLMGKGMPFYKDAMSHGNLYVEFLVDFPKPKELKNIGELKKVLPVPKDLLTNFDRSKAEIMDDYEEGKRNTKASGGKRKRGNQYDEDYEDEEEDDDEEDGGMPRGQRVQCAQQ